MTMYYFLVFFFLCWRNKGYVDKIIPFGFIKHPTFSYETIEKRKHDIVMIRLFSQWHCKANGHGFSLGRIILVIGKSIASLVLCYITGSNAIT